MARIFISHSHSDQAIASSLVIFLLAALKLDEQEILCTSNPDQGLSFSPSSITDQLKNKLNNSEALIILITTESIDSDWIYFEAGAFWTTDKPIIPILGPHISQSDLLGPLRNFLSISIKENNFEDKLNNAINQISKKLSIEQKFGTIRKNALREFSGKLGREPSHHKRDNPLKKIRKIFKKTLDIFPSFYNWCRNINKWFRYSFLVILSVLICVLYIMIYPPIPTVEQVCNNTPEFISCGEKDLLPPEEQQPLTQETDGRQAFKDHNYQKAVSHLEEAWKNGKYKNPTILIALNNAQIMDELKSNKVKQENVFTIAISSGFSQMPRKILFSLVTGVARAQDEFNNKKNNYNCTDCKLMIVMADDKNDKDQAIKIAKELANKKKIIGIIGPYSSKATYYQIDELRKSESKIVLVSASSTATVKAYTDEYKKDNKSEDMSWFFRPVSTTESGAIKLVKHLEQQDYKRILVLYQQNDLFSQSFFNEFKKQLYSSTLKAIQNIDIDAVDDFLIKTEIENFKSKNNHVKKDYALVILPDAFINPSAWGKIENIIKENKENFFIAGSNPLFSFFPKDLFAFFPKDIKTQSLENMVINIPWYPSPEKKKELDTLFSESNLETLFRDSIIWQAAMSYDATSMLIKAILQQRGQGQTTSGEGTQRVLANSKIEFEGLTGTFHLNGPDREPSISSLVSPKCSNNSCEWHEIP